MPPEFVIHQISLEPPHIPLVPLGRPFQLRIRARRASTATAVQAAVPLTCSPAAFSIEPASAPISFEVGQEVVELPIEVTLTGPVETLIATITLTYEGLPHSVVVQPRVPT